MRKTYHICLSGGDEAIFRDTEDYHRGFNTLALALYKSDSTGLVESIMATHLHTLVQTSAPDRFMYYFRNSYSKYFNCKYLRRGPLGEKDYFSLEVVGYHHTLAAASYVLRNAVHHGVVPIPYAYPHCSANSIFRKDMGKFLSEPLVSKERSMRFLGRHVAEFPETYKMTESGVFTRESVLDIPQVESLFVTPRAYNYYMCRKTSEEWEREQQKDAVSGVEYVTLTSIEKGVTGYSLGEMLQHEAGKGDYRKISDIELCTELNEVVRVRFHKESVYALTESERNALANDLYYKRHLSVSQIKRCLAIR